MLNFTLNLLILFYAGLENWVLKIKGSMGKHFFKFIGIKPYIFCVQIIYINTLPISSTRILISCLAVFNIAMVIGELLVLKTTNVSYRFEEKSYLRKKNTSIITWLALIPILASLHKFGIVYGAVLMLMRNVAQLYFNFCNL